MRTNTLDLRSWWMAARPKTLSAAWVPVLVATALSARFSGQFNGMVLACALLSSLFIQVATNLFNDAIDHRKGADTEARLGPTRVTASGMISSRAVFTAGWLCAAVAFSLGIPLVLQGGLPILAVGVVSLFLAYGYTGGPFPLAYLGLGDLFVILFFGLIAVGGTTYLHSGSIESFEALAAPALMAGLQIGLWAAVLIAINNFRDSAEDLRNKKLTLAARFGTRFSRIEISTLLFLPFLVGAAYWPSAGAPLAGLLPLLTLPVAFLIARRIWLWQPSPAFNGLLALAGALHAVAGLLLAGGLLW